MDFIGQSIGGVPEYDVAKQSFVSENPVNTMSLLVSDNELEASGLRVKFGKYYLLLPETGYQWLPFVIADFSNDNARLGATGSAVHYHC